MMKTFMAVGLFMTLGTATALADQASANACAGSLDPEAKAIYAAAIGSVGSTDLKSLLTAKTKSLVMAGTVSRGTAKASAMAAAQCLEMAQ